MCLLKIIVALIFANTTTGTKLFQKASDEDGKLSKEICKITNENVKLQNYTQDIMLANFGGEIWSSTINAIA